ncbi:MAG: hypothetical protein JKY37_23690 [Nannocystaceae bacterium]|nr:hypothetical protein [Nannocystaceae bacterium]
MLPFFFCTWAALAGGPAGEDPAARPDIAERLAWSAPDACPSGESVRHQVRGLVDPSLVTSAVEIDAVVVRESEQSFTLRIDVRGEAQQSQREFTSSDCDELATAAALIAALAIDPFGFASRTRQPQDPGLDETLGSGDNEPQEPDTGLDPPSESSPDTSKPPSPPAPSPPAASPWPNWSLVVSAGPLWTNETRPSATLRALASRRWRIFAVRFGVEGWLPRRFQDTRDTADSGISVGRLLVRAQGCASLGSTRLSVPACLGLASGGMIARGYGVPAPQTRASLSAAFTGSVGLRWQPGAAGGHATPLSLFAAVEAQAHTTRPRFHIGTQGSQYSGSVLALIAVAGVEISLQRAL